MQLFRKVSYQQTITYLFHYAGGFIVVDDNPLYIAAGFYPAGYCLVREGVDLSLEVPPPPDVISAARNVTQYVRN